ncbi:MAG: molybdenum cofactor guanylyltransferase [bacterium]
MTIASRTVGIILAGGKAKRLGGLNKAAIRIGQKTCLEHIQDKFSQGLGKIAVSVASDSAENINDGLPTILDRPGDSDGGIANVISTCLHWAQGQPEIDFILTSPVDTPFLPDNFVDRLLRRQSDNGNMPVYSRVGRNIHGVHASWPVACLAQLDSLVVGQGLKRISSLHQRLGSVACDFSAAHSDPFLNLNYPEDVKQAQRLSAAIRCSEKG